LREKRVKTVALTIKLSVFLRKKTNRFIIIEDFMIEVMGEYMLCIIIRVIDNDANWRMIVEFT